MLPPVVLLALDDGGPLMAPMSEHQVLVWLVQLVLLVGTARILGWVFKSLGQPPVVGELLAGIILGPTVFGRLFPDLFSWVFGDATVRSVTFGVAWLGVIMLLVVVGFETNLGIIRRYKGAALSVAAGALLLPLAAVFATAFAVPDVFVGVVEDRAVFAGFLALALSVSALPVVAKILLDLGFLKRDFGQITLAAGMTIDSAGWVLLAGLSGIALEGFDPTRLLGSMFGLLAFIALAATVGRWLLDRLLRFALSGGSSLTAAVSITLLAALLGGLVTQALNLEAILGAFVLGIVAARLRHQHPQVRPVIETMTAAFFAPVFFAFSGLRVDLWLLDSTSLVLWTSGLIVLAVVAKMAGTVLGGWLGGVRGRPALALGAGLSALGAVGIVVAIIALNLGVVSETGYTVIVVAALVTSALAPQLLKAVVHGWPVPPDEALRLRDEEVRASSEILGLRRILMPTRGGANSIYAARLVGAVYPDAEVTVMVVDHPPARLLPRLLRRSYGAGPDPKELQSHLPASRLIRRLARDPAVAIAKEAALGYDAVVLGATESDGDTFNTVVDRVLARIEIASIVVRFRQSHALADELPTRIMVPVAATRSTRVAEELAYSLAKAVEGEVVALHVVNRPEGDGLLLPDETLADSVRAGHEMVGIAAAFGERMGVLVRTDVQVASNAEAEIVRRANDGDFDLLVLGTSSRYLSERPFYGHRVSYMLDHAEMPVLVVSLPSARSSFQEL
jgi:Kef-type K+ transport system membrane component KefB/nucleotide-binding universal stress UspA family protein